MDCGNVVLTAQRVGLTQPAVSLHLQRLAEVVGRPLFFTAGRKKEPTPFARDLERALSGPVSILEQASADYLRRLADPAQMTLRVACRSEAIARVAPRLKFSGKVTWTSRSRVDALQDLRDGRVDFAVISARPDLPGIIAKPCFVDQPVLVVPPNFEAPWKSTAFSKAPLASERDEYGRFLKLQHWIFYNSQLPLAASFLAALGLRIDDLERVSYCDDWRAITTMVEHQMGISIVPDSFVTTKMSSCFLAAPWAEASTIYIAASQELIGLPEYAIAWRSLQLQRKLPI